MKKKKRKSSREPELGTVYGDFKNATKAGRGVWVCGVCGVCVCGGGGGGGREGRWRRRKGGREELGRSHTSKSCAKRKNPAARARLIILSYRQSLHSRAVVDVFDQLALCGGLLVRLLHILVIISCTQLSLLLNVCRK